ncbi:MAG TPA: FAD-binding oxidoreductase, partial [Spirochaetia bacterium]|nr:FAD-binding oxidoreductase [Spirochaetia bacterium]
RKSDSNLAAGAHRVIGMRNLSPTTYVLRVDRGGIEFQPGQYVSVGVDGDLNMREYSVYSSPKEPFLEILVKEVEHGLVSRQLRKLKPGQTVRVDGPFGFFLIEDEWVNSKKFYFIATGTGVSPFRSFARTYPGLDYSVIHGVRTLDECAEPDVFELSRYTSCVTRETGGTYAGRVTDYLRNEPPPKEGLFYLCGNCDMIYESFDILTGQGVEPTQLFAEVYF